MKTKTSSISTPVTELKFSPTGISDGFERSHLCLSRGKCGAQFTTRARFL